jgi:hypothetical protein
VRFLAGIDLVQRVATARGGVAFLRQVDQHVRVAMADTVGLQQPSAEFAVLGKPGLGHRRLQLREALAAFALDVCDLRRQRLGHFGHDPSPILGPLKLD